MTGAASPKPDREIEPVPRPEAKPDLQIVGGTAHSGDGAGESRSPGALPIGANHHRAFVGAAESFDVMAAAQFSLLTLLGLRQDHHLLDIGCGSLRAGRLFIAYLEPDRYYGVEPEQWLIDEGIAHEVGEDLIDIKRPVFSNVDDFSLTEFDQQFDFVLAQSIFSHASLSQIERCLVEAKQSLATDGLFVATFVKGEDDYGGDSWVYPGCVSYSLKTMRDLATDMGLACQPIEWHHAAQQTWLVYSHREAERRISVPGDAARILSLERELQLAKEHLAKLQGHPYVKLGMKVVGHPLYARLLGGAKQGRPAA